MAGRNAMRLLQEEKAGAAGGDALLEELGRIAGAGAGLRSLACLDASNLSGTDAVVSLVWWEGGALRRQRYRRFRIRRSGGPDDFAMLAEAVGRLAARVGRGRGRVRTWCCSTAAAGSSPPRRRRSRARPGGRALLLAIAKPNERRGTDAVFVAGAGARSPLPAGTPVLLLLQRVRDEAHRFAVAYHRSLRSKRLLAGPLAGIPGLGPARQARLLDGVRRPGRGASASREELERARPRGGGGGRPRRAAPGGPARVRPRGIPAGLRSAASPRGCFGSETKKVLPWPGALSTQIRPPWSRTISLTMLRPRPAPPKRRVAEESTW